MSLPHFFLREQVLAFESAPVFALHLDADDMKHAKVLRLAVGEHIAVVDAVSDYFECEVVSFEGDELSVSIAQKLSSYARPEVVLVQGLAKGEKMDTIVRHATEVGIAEFVPMTTSRSLMRRSQKPGLKDGLLSPRVLRCRVGVPPSPLFTRPVLSQGRLISPKIAMLC